MKVLNGDGVMKVLNGNGVMKVLNGNGVTEFPLLKLLVRALIFKTGKMLPNGKMIRDDNLVHRGCQVTIGKKYIIGCGSPGLRE